MLFVALLVACGDDGASTQPPDAAPDAGGQESEDTGTPGADAAVDPCEALTWDTFGHGFMLDWCVGCHHSALPEGDRAGAPVGVDLDTPEDARAWSARIEARVGADDAPMPPFGGPDDAEIERLRAWLACGAP